MIVVEKYGGTSVDSIDKLEQIADHLKEGLANNNQYIIVTSAKATRTDKLFEKAIAINPLAKGRELDALLSLGEMEQAALLALVLDKNNIKAISLNAWQVPILVTDQYQEGRIIKVSTERIYSLLTTYQVVVVAGFQGVNAKGDLVTIGRGGSDTIAIAFGEAFNAPCTIYTDVHGVYAFDPRYSKDAKQRPEITYDEMVTISSSGSKVLAPRAALLAKQYQVEVRIAKLDQNGKGGTLLVKERMLENEIITSIISLDVYCGETSHLDEAYLSALMQAIEHENLFVEKIVTKDQKLLIYYRRTEELKMQQIYVKYPEFKKHTKKYCQITLYGFGLKNRYSILTKVYQLLLDAKIEVYSLMQTDCFIEIIVEDESKKDALQLIAKKYQLIEGEDKHE